MTTDELREQIAVKIRDAFYEERDAGGSLHDASFTAADDVLDVLRAAGAVLVQAVP